MSPLERWIRRRLRQRVARARVMTPEELTAAHHIDRRTNKWVGFGLALILAAGLINSAIANNSQHEATATAARVGRSETAARLARCLADNQNRLAAGETARRLAVNLVAISDAEAAKRGDPTTPPELAARFAEGYRAEALSVYEHRDCRTQAAINSWVAHPPKADNSPCESAGFGRCESTPDSPAKQLDPPTATPATTPTTTSRTAATSKPRPATQPDSITKTTTTTQQVHTPTPCPMPTLPVITTCVSVPRRNP